MHLPDFRIISPDTAVFLVYAGINRRHFETFRREKCVFLELPGFDANVDTFSSDASIIRHMHMSQAIYRWVSGAEAVPPSRRVNQYPSVMPDSRAEGGRAFINDFASTHLLYTTATSGDIVVCTPQGHYSEMLIGEIVDDWDIDQVLAVDRFRGEIVPIRRVKWLNVALSRRDFPPQVARRLQNRRAVTRIDQDFYVPIFRMIFDAYIWNEESKLDLFAPSYEHHDPLQPYEAAFIIKWALSGYAAGVGGAIDDFYSGVLEVSAQQYFDGAIVELFALSFASPGKYTIIGAFTGVALYVGAVTAIAISPPNQNISHVKTEVVAELRALNVHADARADRDQVANLVESMTPETASELRRRYGNPARTGVGLTLDSSREVRRARDNLARN